MTLQFIFDLLWFALIGLVAGTVAKFLTRQPIGSTLLTMGLGLGGLAVATVIARLAGWQYLSDAVYYLIATLGAIGIVLLYRLRRRLFK